MPKVFDKLRDLMFGEYDEYDDDEYDDEEYEEEPARETRRTPLRDVNKDREP